MRGERAFVRIFALKTGRRMSGFMRNLLFIRRTNVRVYTKKWQLSLEKTRLYVIIGPVATRCGFATQKASEDLGVKSVERNEVSGAATRFDRRTRKKGR